MLQMLRVPNDSAAGVLGHFPAAATARGGRPLFGPRRPRRRTRRPRLGARRTARSPDVASIRPHVEPSRGDPRATTWPWARSSADNIWRSSRGGSESSFWGLRPPARQAAWPTELRARPIHGLPRVNAHGPPARRAAAAAALVGRHRLSAGSTVSSCRICRSGGANACVYLELLSRQPARSRDVAATCTGTRGGLCDL